MRLHDIARDWHGVRLPDVGIHDIIQKIYEIIITKLSRGNVTPPSRPAALATGAQKNTVLILPPRYYTNDIQLNL